MATINNKEKKTKNVVIPNKRALKWQEKNKWFGEDENRTKIALLLHYVVLKKTNIRPTSQKYYNMVDDFMSAVNNLVGEPK